MFYVAFEGAAGTYLVKAGDRGRFGRGQRGRSKLALEGSVYVFVFSSDLSKASRCLTPHACCGIERAEEDKAGGCVIDEACEILYVGRSCGRERRKKLQGLLTYAAIKRSVAHAAGVRLWWNNPRSQLHSFNFLSLPALVDISWQSSYVARV